MKWERAYEDLMGFPFDVDAVAKCIQEFKHTKVCVNLGLIAAKGKHRYTYYEQDSKLIAVIEPVLRERYPEMFI